MKFVVKYVFTLPSVFDHRNHKLGDESVSRESVDKRVFEKVEDYVRTGITKAPQIKELLKNYIQNELEVDPSQWERRKYNPNLKDIRAKVYRTIRDMKSKVDQPSCGERKENNNLGTFGSSKLKEDTKQFNISQCPEIKHFPTTIDISEQNVKKESTISDTDLQSNFCVDLSEGNVHHEELIAIASIIDVHSNDNDVLEEQHYIHDDTKLKRLIGEDISKLNLLSMILRQQNLFELKKDINNVVNKWKDVLNEACETRSSKRIKIETAAPLET